MQLWKIQPSFYQTKDLKRIDKYNKLALWTQININN